MKNLILFCIIVSIILSCKKSESSKINEPFLVASGHYDQNYHKCVDGYVNLVTGDTNIYKHSCIIYFCFAGGTQITLNNGKLKPIEKLMVGDTILSVKMTTLKPEADVIEDIVSPMHNDIVEFIFSDSTILKSTYDHPYYVKNKGWCSYKPLESKQNYGIKARQFEKGDICLKYKDQKFTEVKLISIKEIPGYITTYNLCSLMKNTSYFANGILVSNEKNY